MWNSLAASLALALLLTAHARAQEIEEAPAPDALPVVDIPDSRVRVSMPKQFSVREGLPGLEHDFPMTQLIVTELPISIDAAIESMAPDLVAERGYYYDRREEFWTESGTGDLFHLKQDIDPADLRHWVFLVGDDKETLRITVTTLLDLESRLAPDVRQLLESIEWKRDQPRDLQSDKSFRVDVPEGLIAARTARQQVEFWGINQIGEAAGLDARAVVSRYTVPDSVEDLESFAEKHLADSIELSFLKDTDWSKAVLGGLPGIELVGEGTAFGHGGDLTVYQVLALDGDKAYVVQGFVSRPQREDFVPIFRRLAASFRRAR